MDELKHRIDLFQTKIDIAISQLASGQDEAALSTLRGALSWDEDIYQKPLTKAN